MRLALAQDRTTLYGQLPAASGRAPDRRTSGLPESVSSCCSPLAAPAGAAAQSVSPRDFEAMAQGHTLYFTLDGAPFGAEQYFSGRRSLWRFADGRCEAGRWWPEADRICFRYDADADAAAECWRFRDRPGGFAAALVENGAETGFVLDLAGSDRTPLDCPGPDVGT